MNKQKRENQKHSSESKKSPSQISTQNALCNPKSSHAKKSIDRFLQKPIETGNERRRRRRREEEEEEEISRDGTGRGKPTRSSVVVGSESRELSGFCCTGSEAAAAAAAAAADGQISGEIATFRDRTALRRRLSRRLATRLAGRGRPPTVSGPHPLHSPRPAIVIQHLSGEREGASDPGNAEGEAGGAVEIQHGLHFFFFFFPLFCRKGGETGRGTKEEEEVGIGFPSRAITLVSGGGGRRE